MPACWLFCFRLEEPAQPVTLTGSNLYKPVTAKFAAKT
jgi:hypothetical protein